MNARDFIKYAAAKKKSRRSLIAGGAAAGASFGGAGGWQLGVRIGAGVTEKELRKTFDPALRAAERYLDESDKLTSAAREGKALHLANNMGLKYTPSGSTTVKVTDPLSGVVTKLDTSTKSGFKAADSLAHSMAENAHKQNMRASEFFNKAVRKGSKFMVAGLPLGMLAGGALGAYGVHKFLNRKKK